MANTFVITPDGRRNGLFAAGDPTADRLVIVFHPSPGAGTFDPDPLVTDHWGVHLVAFDRPGYGATPPLAPRAPHRIADRVDDVAAYLGRAESNADQISSADLGSVGAIGWGTGGMLALAFAARHPDLVDRVALVDAPAPRKAAKLARRAFIADPSIAALHVDDTDPDLARHAGLLGRLQRMVADAFVQDRAGVDADRLLMADDSWIGDLDSVRADTHLWLGTRDPVVDEDDVRWYGRRLPGARAHRVRDSGPLAIAAAWQSILGHVAPLHGRIDAEERDRARPRVADIDGVHPGRA